jgi:hypothetical protein
VDVLFISKEFSWYRIIGATIVFLAGCVIIISKVKRKGEEPKALEVSQKQTSVAELVPNSERKELK